MSRIWVASIWLVGCAVENGLLADLPTNTEYGTPPTDLEPDEVEDRFLQALSPETDVLFIVDNSNSMQGEQALLGRNFPRFLDWFVDVGIDFHIGVVSTDMYDRNQAGLLRDSQGQRWIDADTPDAADRFEDLANLGVDGANDERGRAAAFTAIELRADEGNTGFLRPDASLHLVVVSDEEDNSGDLPVSLQEFVSYLDLLKDDPLTTTFSSIVGGAQGSPVGPFCNPEPGTEYLEVTRAVGGVEWSICEPDWDPILDELGILASGLTRDFFLSQVPVPDTLEVSIRDGEDLQTFPTPSDAWTYDAARNKVSFTELPPAGSQVRIRYTVADGV